MWWAETDRGKGVVRPDSAYVCTRWLRSYDYGDAPDVRTPLPSPYPTFKLHTGARHLWKDLYWHWWFPHIGTIDPSIQAWLGKFPASYNPNIPNVSSEGGIHSIDFEYDARTDGSGVPLDNLDDGIYFFPTPEHYCQSCILDSIDVMVNTDPLYNKENNIIFHAWFDWNGDGDWNDERACSEDNIVYEHMQWAGATLLWPPSSFTSFNITDSEIAFFPSAWGAKICAVYRLYFYTWPEPASEIWTRFRLTPDIPVNHSTSFNHYDVYTDKVTSGEVEDYLIQCQQIPDSCDYGDAPDELDFPYNTHYCSHLLAGSTSAPVFPPRVSPPPWTSYEAAYHENFDYEWLGNIEYECECADPPADAEYNGRTINLDNFDNGVDFTDINYLVCETQKVRVLINVDEDFARSSGRYDSDKLHLHAWFDWNRNGDWDDETECQTGTPADDHIYWLTAQPLCGADFPPVLVESHDFEIDPTWWLYDLERGCQMYELTFLAGDTSLSSGDIEHVSDTLWCRFRLSYDGDGGTVADEYHEGVKFGEVEDYPLYSQQGTIQCQCTIEKVHINGISVDEGERIDIVRTSPDFS